MRRKLWIGTLIVAVGSVVGYWWHTPRKADPTVDPVTPFVGPMERGGGTEESELIEPLQVEVRYPVSAPAAEPFDNGPPPRVVLEPDMEQPPRPDVEPGTKLRMPYADEEEGLGLTRVPELEIGAGPARQKLFELFDKANQVEEAPASMPPLSDYHHPHCPYQGGCPAPYPPRALPRE